MPDIIKELQRINDFEKNFKRLKLTQNTNFKVDVTGNISFDIDGRSYRAPVNRPIIHQLGSRIWPAQKGEYESVFDNWSKEFLRDKFALAATIVSKLKESSSILLLDDKSNKLYGIISEHFTQIDPLDFRKRFIEEYSDTGLPLKNESKFERTHFGELMEKYSFNESSLRKYKEPIEYNFQIIYGLNNGYSSFRVRLGRTILACTNGLTAYEGLKSAKLKHTSNADISVFVDGIKDDTLRYNHRFQKTIEKAKNRSNQPIQINELFQRVHAAAVVKSRIKERFEAEKSVYGDNEWALSQAFTHLATHFYKPSRHEHYERILTDVGSDILDNSVEYVLDLEATKKHFGELETYGNLLPKGFLEK